MSKPVIFTAFSNEQGRYLKTLNKERELIETALLQLHDDGILQHTKEGNATRDNIFKKLHHYDNKLAIFHYAGHAGGQQILVETQSGGNMEFSADKLAQLLGLQKKLQLVFLNGCATKPQVELLFKYGVKAVIATSVEIDDETATQFSRQFYESLAKEADDGERNTIKEAFEYAKLFVSEDDEDKNIKAKEAEIQVVEDTDSNSEKEKSPANKGTRSIKIPSEGGKDKMPWRLYINKTVKDAEKVLEWSLPKQYKPSEESKSVNKELGRLLFTGLYDDNNEVIHNEFKKDNPDENIIYGEIIDSFPLPIGEHLRKFWSDSPDMNKPTEKRLQQIGQCYYDSSKLLAFTLLSQLWDEMRARNGKLAINKELQNLIKTAFESQKDAPPFDYFELFGRIKEFFEKNKIEFFLERMKELDKKIEENEELKGGRFSFAVEKLRAVHAGEITDVEQCIVAERHLGRFLLAFTFLTAYDFYTIINIGIIQQRHLDRLFEHKFLHLKKAGFYHGKTLNDNELKSVNNTDNKSIVFVKKVKEDEVEDEKKMKVEYLNLTPFIIDENALIGKSDAGTYAHKLFLFNHRIENDKYAFQFIKHLDHPEMQLEIPENVYVNIKDLFDEFMTDVLGIRKEEIKDTKKSKQPDGKEAAKKIFGESN